jgi:hypothetical protein
MRFTSVSAPWNTASSWPQVCRPIDPLRWLRRKKATPVAGSARRCGPRVGFQAGWSPAGTPHRVLTLLYRAREPWRAYEAPYWSPSGWNLQRKSRTKVVTDPRRPDPLDHSNQYSSVPLDLFPKWLQSLPRQAGGSTGSSAARIVALASGAMKSENGAASNQETSVCLFDEPARAVSTPTSAPSAAPGVRAQCAFSSHSLHLARSC